MPKDLFSSGSSSLHPTCRLQAGSQMPLRSPSLAALLPSTLRSAVRPQQLLPRSVRSPRADTEISRRRWITQRRGAGANGRMSSAPPAEGSSSSSNSNGKKRALEDDVPASVQQASTAPPSEGGASEAKKLKPDEASSASSTSAAAPATSTSASTPTPINAHLLARRPLSGVFAINKPSGRTSMSLLEDLKPLFASSALFHDPSSSGASGGGGGGGGGGGAKKLTKAQKRSRSNRNKFGAEPPKIGQGGTLDPLADGVLGESISLSSSPCTG